MNKSQVKTKEDLELYYSKVRKIRFKEEDLKFNSIEELFKRFVRRDINDTYYKKGSLHCNMLKQRSIDDFIVIAKYYFPDITVKNILSELLTFLETPHNIGYDNMSYAYISYCSVIRKNNLWYSAFKTSWGSKPEKIFFSQNGFKNCNLTLKSIIE
jgi:hypothetical protein